MNIAAACRDDAGGDRSAETEGIADGQDPVTDFGGVAVTPGNKGQRLVGVYLEEGKIGHGVAANDLRWMLGVILEAHRYCAGLAGDVVVGDDVALRIDDEA